MSWKSIFVIVLFSFLQARFCFGQLSISPRASTMLEKSIDFEKRDSLFWMQSVEKAQDTVDQLDNLQKAQIHQNCGEAMLHVLNADSALHFFEMAEPFLPPSSVEKAALYMSTSDAWYQKMIYSKSSEYLFQALEILEQSDDDKRRGICLSKIGDVLDLMERYEESVDYFHQAIALQKQIGAREDLAKSYQGMSRAYIFVDSLDKAMEIIDLAISTYQDHRMDSTELHRSFNSKGNLFKYLNQYDSAIHYYTLNLDYFQKKKDPTGLIVANGNLSHAYRLSKQYQTALPYALKAIELANETGQDKYLWENNMHASIIYEMLGDFEKSLEYNIVFANEREKLFEQNIQNLKAEYQIQYETEKKDQEIQTQRLALASSRRIQALITGIVVLLSLFLAGLFWVYHNNRKKNALLEAKNSENELLLKEIHHRVKNNLERISSLLYLQSNSIDDPNALDAIRESQNRVHSMSLIHKKLYTGKNLAAIEIQDYLKSLGDSMLDTFVEDEDQITMHYDIDPLEIDVDTAIPIGLIVNELLTNSLKYAFPDNRQGHIHITFKQSGEQLQLEVKDNGIGMQASSTDNEPKGTGFGTQLIQLLTTQLEGKMTKLVEHGTQFTFVFHNFKLA